MPLRWWLSNITPSYTVELFVDARVCTVVLYKLQADETLFVENFPLPMGGHSFQNIINPEHTYNVRPMINCFRKVEAS